MVTEKYERQEELLSSMIKQRQATVNDHISGRKLMDDEVCSIFDMLWRYYCNFFIFRLYVDISVIVFLWSFSRYAYLSCSPSSFQYYDITGISPRIETYQGITPQVGCCSTERSSCKFSILFPHFITCILDKTVLTLIGILPTNSLQLTQMLKLEIEQEIELQERMMKGEFSWTPGAEDLVLKEDP